MTRWMHPPERSHQGKQDDFDPVTEGARHGLDRELSLTIWERVCLDATDSAGRRDVEQARRRFHEIAARLAARGGRVRPAVLRQTRVEVEVEVDGDRRRATGLDDLAVRHPGRETLAAVEARRWSRLHAEQSPARLDTERSDPPGTSEVSRAMTALRAPPQPAQRAPLEASLLARSSPLSGFDFGGIEVAPDRIGALFGRPRGAAITSVARTQATERTDDARQGSVAAANAAAGKPRDDVPREASDKETLASARRRRPAPRKVTRASRVGHHLFRKADPEVALPAILLRGGAVTDGELAVEATLRPSGGTPLPATIRARLEHEFGCDLSSVRLHHDATAAMAARTIAARAFTIGDSIFFLRAPDFDSPADFALLAHEVTHVVQYYQGRVEVQRDLAVSTPDHPLEREAEAMGEALARRHPAPPSHRSGPLAAPARELMGSAGFARPHAIGRPATLYRSGDKGSEPSGWSKAGDWILGVLAGDFNEDPSTSQIIVRTLLTLIPIVDQVGDVEDLAAALYKLIWQERYNEFDPWFGLVVSLIGLFPELGSALKGVIKLIFKGAKKNLDKILKLLEPLGHRAGKLIGDLIDKLPDLGKQLGGKARALLRDLAAKTDEVIAKLRRVPKLIAATFAKNLGRLIARLERFSKAVRAAMQVVEKRVAEVFAQLRRQLDHVKDAFSLARRIGFANAARLFRVVDPGDLAKLGKLEDAALHKLVKLDDGALRKVAKLDDATLSGYAKLIVRGDELANRIANKILQAGDLPGVDRWSKLASRQIDSPAQLKDLEQSLDDALKLRHGDAATEMEVFYEKGTGRKLTAAEAVAKRGQTVNVDVETSTMRREHKRVNVDVEERDTLRHQVLDGRLKFADAGLKRGLDAKKHIVVVDYGSSLKMDPKTALDDLRRFVRRDAITRQHVDELIVRFNGVEHVIAVP